MQDWWCDFYVLRGIWYNQQSDKIFKATNLRKKLKQNLTLHPLKLKYLSYIEKKPIQGGLGQPERYLRNHKGEQNQLMGKI